MSRRWWIQLVLLLGGNVAACSSFDPTVPIRRDAAHRVWRPGHRVGKAWCPGYWDNGGTPVPHCPYSRR